MATYTFDNTALLKLLLHAARYPHASVNGLLLGRKLGSGDEPGSPRASGVAITDAVPLFHAGLTLAPQTEVALAQIEALCQQRDLSIVGYYHGEARFDGPADLTPVGRRIADRIADRQPSACALVLNNHSLAQFTGAAQPKSQDVCPLEFYLRDASKAWKRLAASNDSYRLAPAGGASWRNASDAFLAALAKGAQHNLHDFDEHLDDPAADYMNPKLLAGL